MSPRLEIVLAALVTAGPRAAIPADLVLNEVLYDPAGADTGGEFVEIYNGGDALRSLEGVGLEFANGAVGPVWERRWTGGPADLVPAGGRFLIVDRGWLGEPAGDAEARLELQNGPDAIRLVQADVELDRLGYGALEHPELYEGTPCPDVASGHALARRPDGRDTDRNADDWREVAVPTPGRANFADHALELLRLRCEPPVVLRSPAAVLVEAQVRNAGILPLPAAPARLRAGGAVLAGWFEGAGPEEACWVRFTWQAAVEGTQALALAIPAPAGALPDSLCLDLGAYRVGPAALYLSEVMAAPVAGGCEWVEIANAGAADLALAAYRLRDEDGDWVPLPERALPPGERLVLVQDRDRFLDWWAGLLAAGARPRCAALAGGADAAIAELAGAWPNLNNAAPDDRAFADAVWLAAAAGPVIDHVALGLDGVEVATGRSLERTAWRPLGSPGAVWRLATDAAGATPGCPNGVATAVEPGAEPRLVPNPFAPAAGGADAVLHLLFDLGDAAGWDACVYDLDGRRVRDLGGDDLGPGPRDVIWDGRRDDGRLVSPGAYVVLLRLRDAGGRPLASRKQLAVVRPGETR